MTIWKRILALGLTLCLALSMTNVLSCAASGTGTRLPAWVTIFRAYQMQINRDAEEKRTPTYGSTEIDDIDYWGDGSEFHRLDVYNPGTACACEKLPVIVEVHGGGYASCNKEINREHGLWFASQGYRVVNINYTLVPEGTIAQEEQEIRRVFNWIRSHANAYGFDANHIFLTGDSSGGHLVLLFTAAQTDPDLQRVLGITPAPGYRATAATCPVGSFTSKELVSMGLSALLGSDFKSRNDSKALGYENFLKPGIPPLLIVTTPTDKTAYSVTSSIHKTMVERGIEHQYKEYTKVENSLDHVFNVLNVGWVESLQCNRDIVGFFQSQIQ